MLSSALFRYPSVMATISRIRIAWNGTAVVGPGVSTLYYNQTDMAGVPAAVLNFFDVISNFFPTGITWTVPSAGDQIDDATGDLVGAWAASGGGTTTSSGGAADYMPGVGARLRWATLGIHGGRRVTGTTFLVPLTEQEITAGVVQSGTRASIETAAAALFAGALNLAVWGPPLPPSQSHGSVPGAAFEVQSASVPSAMTWLRSRRT